MSNQSKQGRYRYFPNSGISVFVADNNSGLFNRESTFYDEGIEYLFNGKLSFSNNDKSKVKIKTSKNKD